MIILQYHASLNKRKIEKIWCLQKLNSVKHATVKSIKTEVCEKYWVAQWTNRTNERLYTQVLVCVIAC